MWRIAASMGLMFLAVGWSVAAMIIIFLIVPFAWESVFGPRGAPYAAVVAFGLAIWSSARMMRLADRLLGESDRHAPSREAVAAEAVDAGAPESWQEYSDEIVRNKRWAFYRRTRQFHRLAALEDERRRAAQREPAAVP